MTATLPDLSPFRRTGTILDATVGPGDDLTFAMELRPADESGGLFDIWILGEGDDVQIAFIGIANYDEVAPVFADWANNPLADADIDHIAYVEDRESHPGDLWVEVRFDVFQEIDRLIIHCRDVRITT